jgi:phage/plasmid-like protein (TIGR03299 family)
MSADVEKMMFVGEVPWHGLGFRLENPPTIQEAITASGLDWTVNLKPLVVKETQAEVGWNATVRDSDGSVLGVVGPTYKPLQNKDAFSWFQPFVDSGMATLETAGSLKKGKRVWVLARIKGDPIEIVKGDAVERFIMLSNSHDGTLAVRVGFCGIRVVCSNTMAMAHSDAASKLLRVRHTEKAVHTLEKIREIMDVANQEFLATAEQYRALAKLRVDEATLKEYVRLVFQPKLIETAPVVQDEEEKDGRADKLFNKILPLFETGRGNDLPGVAGTMWSALNSVSEYLTWERGRNVDNRLDSLWFGDSAKVNQRALQVAFKMAVAG